MKIFHTHWPGVCLVPLLLTGCAAIPPSKQRLVAKPNMLFSDSSVFSYGSRLLVQLEPGAGASGGAANSGCTSCR